MPGSDRKAQTGHPVSGHPDARAERISNDSAGFIRQPADDYLYHRIRPVRAQGL